VPIARDPAIEYTASLRTVPETPNIARVGQYSSPKQKCQKKIGPRALLAVNIAKNREKTEKFLVLASVLMLFLG